MNFDIARTNMLKHQIRACKVLDDDVLDLLGNSKRENYVPEAYKQFAYADMNIPLPNGQVMMSPLEEAHMLQALSITADDNVLEIGTGTGYVTSLLAKQARHVDSIDIFPEFTRAANDKLQQNNIHNVTLLSGDIYQDHPFAATRYNVIAITGSIPPLDKQQQFPLKRESLDKQFLHQLERGGRLFAIVGEAPMMEAHLLIRENEHAWLTEFLFETDLLPLINAPSCEEFIF